MQASLKAGKVTTLPNVNTIADGTAVKTPGEKIFPYIQKNLDDIITVEDDELVVAFLDMVENHKMVIENLRSADRCSVKASECERKTSGIDPEWRQHGCDHHVLRGTAGTDFP